MKKNGHKSITHLRDLLPDAKNARRHTPRNVGTIVDALHEVGAARSIVIDEEGTILAGNATIEAAAEAGIEKVQVVDADGQTIIAVRRTGLSAKQKTRLALFDNRAAELAGWDADILQTFEPDELKGVFSDKELNEILSEIQAEPKDAEPQIDKAEELRQKWSTETGQLWVIGNHRLLVGDATKKADVERLLGGMRPLLVLSDPPYGVDYDGGTTKRERLVGDKAPNLYAPFLQLIRPLLADNAGLYLFYADGDAAVTQAVTQAGFIVRNTLIWNKNQAQFGALSAQYKQKHEPFLYCHIKGKSPQWFGPTNEVTVWDCDRASSNNLHPTQKPVELFERALKNSSKVKDAVLEGFAGSGTALVACENVQRKAYCLEIDAGYVAVCLERMTTAFPHLKIEKADKAVAA